MPRAIVVLSDGETWTETGTILVVTDEAFQRLCDDSDYPKNLEPEDIVWEMSAT